MTVIPWSQYMPETLPPLDSWLLLYTIISLFVLTLAKKLLKFVYTYAKSAWIWRNLPGTINPYFFVRMLQKMGSLYDFQRETCETYTKAAKKRVDFIKAPYSPSLEVLVCSQEAYDFLFFQKNCLTDTFDRRKYVPFAVFAELFGNRSLPMLRNANRHPSEQYYWKKQTDFLERFLPRLSDLKPGHHLYKRMWKNLNTETDCLLGTLTSELNGTRKNRVDVLPVVRSFIGSNMKYLLFGSFIEELERDKETDIVQTFYDAQKAILQATVFRLKVYALVSILPFPLNNVGRWFGNRLGEENNEFNQIKEDFQEYTKNAIRTAKRLDLDVMDKNKDLVCTFLRERMWDDELLTSILFVCIGGTYSGSALPAWSIYYIAKDKGNVKKELYKELSKCLREKNVEDVSHLSAVELDALPYLNGVLREAGRLRPPTFHGRVEAGVDLQFTDGTKFPKGTKFIYLPYAYGNLEENYKNYAEFIPERWITKDGTSENIKRGPTDIFENRDRKCLGKYYILLQTKMLIANLIMNFEICMDENDANKIKKGLGLNLEIADEGNNNPTQMYVNLSPRKNRT
eukprot:snap_masked-scaffold_6-processed-gene-2.3-mRNA-1 protein AED:1.00 eAED:1.00 QI:0/-1/0/0/-1/1/1/0/569